MEIEEDKHILFLDVNVLLSSLTLPHGANKTKNHLNQKKTKDDNPNKLLEFTVTKFL